MKNPEIVNAMKQVIGELENHILELSIQIDDIWLKYRSDDGLMNSPDADTYMELVLAKEKAESFLRHQEAFLEDVAKVF